MKKWQHGALIFLRGTSLSLLIILLFGLLFESKESRTEKPLFINLIDNSSSMLNYRDSTSVKKNIASFREGLEERYGDRFEIIDYYLDESIKDSVLDFKGQLTDLNQGFELIYNQFYSRNIGGICLISDGNYNTGSNPLYTAERIRMTPVFSIGVGDTVTKKDQMIRNVLANSVAFTGNQFPVEIELEADRMPGARAKVSIFSGGQVVATRDFVYSNDNHATQRVDFLLEAKTPGFVHYTVVLEKISGEITYVNNSQSFYMEVLDSRSKVLILSEAPHPDVSAVKQVLDRDDKLTVISKLYSDWDKDLKEVELLVVHGFHGSEARQIIRQIKSKGIPVFYLADLRTGNNDLKDLGISANVPSGSREDEVQGYPQSSFQLFELSEELKQLIDKAPPVHVRFGSTTLRAGDLLIGQRVGPVKKSDPVFFFGGNMNDKYAVFLGEGLWRWKLYEFQRTGEFKGFEELISKTAQYLLVKSNKEPLRVLLKNRYSEIKDVLVNAEFYNASMERIIEPDISLELKDEQGRTINYQFSKNTADYTLNIGKLKAGKYKWKAATKYDGKSYRKEGEFVVEKIELEAKNRASNFNLLYQISEKTNGSFHELKDSDRLLGEIAERDDIVDVVYEESDFRDLIDIVWMLVLLALFLSLEWFLRRWKGSY